MKTLEDALAAIETMKADHEAEKAAILKKNKELVDRERAAKTAADEAEAAREEAATDAASKAGDIETLKAQIEKKHAAELKKRDDILAKMTGELSTLKIDNVISDAISKNGVMPKHVRAATLILKDGLTMKDGEAVYADGTPLAEGISTFFSSAEGNDYVHAPANSGGGATGSSAKAAKWSKPPQTASEKFEWDREVATNPTHANSLADSWGRPDLKG